MLTTDVDLARLVQEVRSRNGLTQEQFAARLGVTFPTINRWERGRVKPSPLALRQIRFLLHEMGDNGRDLLDRYFGVAQASTRSSSLTS